MSRIQLSPFSWFRARNRAVCERLAGVLPHTKVNVFRTYEDLVVDQVQNPRTQLVVDMGAGNSTPWADRRPQERWVKLIGIDVSERKMEANTDVDEKLVANITRRLPFADANIDLVTSRSVLEHLDNVEAFVAEANRVLRPGGYTVHLFTGRFAWFALLNRLVNHTLARRTLYRLHPESRDKGGFPAHYDQCTYSGITSVFRRNGFDIVDIRLAYGTNYAYFFVPLFLLVSLYEIALQALHLKNLAATLVVVARKA